MIGNAYPYRDTRFSILEEGELDPATWSLRVDGYRVVHPDGTSSDRLFASRELAERAIDGMLKSG